jgi:hypothetical protein
VKRICRYRGFPLWMDVCTAVLTDAPFVRHFLQSEVALVEYLCIVVVLLISRMAPQRGALAWQ